MKLFCIHSWSRWSQVVGMNGGLFQFRYCRKCWKAENRPITAA